MGINPSSVTDLSSAMGTAAGTYQLRVYTTVRGWRVTISFCGTEGDGIEIPTAALATVQAAIAAVGS
jgi:hypothetical protein